LWGKHVVLAETVFARQAAVWSAVERNAKSGGAVLNMVIGAFAALAFFGLPLAIIGLFIASTLDRRHARPPEGFAASRESSASASVTNHGGDRRRRIIYGQYSVSTTASAERYGPRRAQGRKA
jgi:uncharacterized membrane protein